MISSLNRMLAKMDTFVAGERFLGTEVDTMALDTVNEWDMSYVSLQMPNSDLSFAYELNKSMEFHNYKIMCVDGPYPIDRFFAMLLFDSIRTKETGGMVFDGPPDQFDMSKDVLIEELKALIDISFISHTVTIRWCELVRCAKVAHKYWFWKPLRLFLWGSIHAGISRDIADIRQGLDSAEAALSVEHRTELAKVEPSVNLPRKYEFSLEPVTGVTRGHFYGEYQEWRHVLVVGVEEVTPGTSGNVYVLTWPDRSLRNVPINKLRAVLGFDDVKARVGYPVFDRIEPGVHLARADDGPLHGRVGTFCTYHDSNTMGRTNAVLVNDYTLAFILGFSNGVSGAYVLLRSRVEHVALDELCTIVEGQGGTDDDARRRADVIVNAKTPPMNASFSDRSCESIGELVIGKYYQCPSAALYGRTIADHRRSLRTAVLYLGVASDTEVFIYGNKREARVEFKYLHFQNVEEGDSEDEQRIWPALDPRELHRNTD